MKRKIYTRLVTNLALISNAVEYRDKVFRYIMAEEMTPEIEENMENCDLLIQDSINTIEKEMNDCEHLTSYLVNEVLIEDYSDHDYESDSVIVINDKEYKITPDNVYYILTNKVKKLK